MFVWEAAAAAADAAVLAVLLETTLLLLDCVLAEEGCEGDVVVEFEDDDDVVDIPFGI